MVQQTFPVDTRKPRVIITHLHGNLNVQPWENQAILVDAAGEVEILRQEGEVVIIAHCHGDLTLWVPAITMTIFPITTSIAATDVSGHATLEKTRNVSLRNVGGQVVLRDIRGNVDVEEVQESTDATSIGGNLTALHVPHLSAQNIGGNAQLTALGAVEIQKLGGNLDAALIESHLHCRTVGGNCNIHDCANADVNIRTVGGNLRCDDGTLSGLLSSVGGNLHLVAMFQPSSQSDLHVGGNAHVTLPPQANLTLHATVGGNASGPDGTYTRGGGFVNLVYGEGMARLNTTVGGNLSLAGCQPRR